MSKEKVKSLTKYSDDIKNKLTSPTPDKHKDHPGTYKKFLERELDSTNKKIASLKV